MSDIAPGIPDPKIPLRLWKWASVEHAGRNEDQRQIIQTVADQQLERCVDYLERMGCSTIAAAMAAAMRPEPPSLKQQALARLEAAGVRGEPPGLRYSIAPADMEVVRKALESLPD